MVRVSSQEQQLDLNKNIQTYQVSKTKTTRPVFDLTYFFNLQCTHTSSSLPCTQFNNLPIEYPIRYLHVAVHRRRFLVVASQIRTRPERNQHQQTHSEYGFR